MEFVQGKKEAGSGGSILDEAARLSGCQERAKVVGRTRRSLLRREGVGHGACKERGLAWLQGAGEGGPPQHLLQVFQDSGGGLARGESLSKDRYLGPQA